MPVHQRRVDKWCRRAATLTGMLHRHKEEFSAITETYEKTRNMAYNYPEGMENVDEAYGELTDAKNAFCALQAGGARRTRRSRKGKKGTRRH